MPSIPDSIQPAAEFQAGRVCLQGKRLPPGPRAQNVSGANKHKSENRAGYWHDQGLRRSPARTGLRAQTLEPVIASCLLARYAAWRVRPSCQKELQSLIAFRWIFDEHTLSVVAAAAISKWTRSDGLSLVRLLSRGGARTAAREEEP